MSKEAVRKGLQGADGVLHLAALLRKAPSSRLFDVNVTGTESLVEEARRQGIRHFIYVSSENALREDLQDAYAATKRRAESFVRNLTNALILRPCFVYGPGDFHGLGRLVEIAEKSFLVPLFGNLTNQIQPLYIEDMIEYLCLAVQNQITGEYILAGPEKINLNDFIKKVCEIKQRRRVFLTIPYPVLRLTAALGDLFGPSFGWGLSPLKNIYGSRTYAIEQTVKAFGHSPCGVNEGLRRWFETKEEGQTVTRSASSE